MRSLGRKVSQKAAKSSPVELLDTRLLSFQLLLFVSPAPRARLRRLVRCFLFVGNHCSGATFVTISVWSLAFALKKKRFSRTRHGLVGILRRTIRYWAHSFSFLVSLTPYSHLLFSGSLLSYSFSTWFPGGRMSWVYISPLDLP